MEIPTPVSLTQRHTEAIFFFQMPKLNYMCQKVQNMH